MFQLKKCSNVQLKEPEIPLLGRRPGEERRNGVESWARIHLLSVISLRCLQRQGGKVGWGISYYLYKAPCPLYLLNKTSAFSPTPPLHYSMGTFCLPPFLHIFTYDMLG